MSTFDVSTLKVALCQIGAGSDKEANIKHAAAAIGNTADAQLVVSIVHLWTVNTKSVLPSTFNQHIFYPYR